MSASTPLRATTLEDATTRAHDGRSLRRAWGSFVLFMALSGIAWIHAFGIVAAVCVLLTTTIVSAVAWIRLRPPVQWRRLPWFPTVYVAWAAVSVVWSAWPTTTALTWLLLAITAFLGLYVAATLTWRELVGSMATALKWVLSLSLVLELYVSIFVQHPLLPGFAVAYTPMEPFLYWSHNQLFTLDRIQGIVGNANLLAAVCAVAVIVFSVRIAARAQHRLVEILWLGLALFLLVRAASATAYVSLAAAAVVLGAIMLMRTTSRPQERNRIYLLFAGIGALGAVAFAVVPNTFFTLLGRSSDFTGREDIWEKAIARAVERPVFGWGFATPWPPWDPMFSNWILDHNLPVMQAHNMWIDIFLQLGAIGVFLVGVIYVTFLWRSWFFAVDRPRWDIVADRPYSALSVLPALLATVLLVQGVTESGPLMLWGWMFVVMLTFKIKQAPVVGHGPAESHSGAVAQSRAARRGQARAIGF